MYHERDTKLTTGKDGNMLVSSSPGHRPLQLITFEKTPTAENKLNTTIKIHEENMQSVLELAGDLPLCTLCICGPARKGKSYMLSHILRSLDAAEKGEIIEQWINEHCDKPLDKRFTFRNGRHPVTEGIWIWSKPFIVSRRGSKLAVLVVVTQGTNDDVTSTRDMNAIVGNSALFSSVMIFNCFKDIQEDILDSLATYVEYGKIAMQNLNNSKDKPFQNLVFLIRDFNMPDEYCFGKDGGARLIEEKLKIKDRQPESSKMVRETIKQTFEKVECYLMPYIGKAAISNKYDGNMADVDPEFLEHVRDFLCDLVENGLHVKKLDGTELTGNEFFDCLRAYVRVFNSGTTLTPLSIWEANTVVVNNICLRKAFKQFAESYRQCVGGAPYLNPMVLDEAFATSTARAVYLLRSIGVHGSVTQLEAKLMKKIHNQINSERLKNEAMRNDTLSSARDDAINSFKKSLTDKLSVPDDENFHLESAELKQFTIKAKKKVVDIYRKYLQLESNYDMLVMEEQIRKELDEIVSAQTMLNVLKKEKAIREVEKFCQNTLRQFCLTVRKLSLQNSGDTKAVWNEMQDRKREMLKYFDNELPLSNGTLRSSSQAKLAQQMDEFCLDRIENLKMENESRRRNEMLEKQLNQMKLKMEHQVEEANERYRQQQESVEAERKRREESDRRYEMFQQELLQMRRERERQLEKEKELRRQKQQENLEAERRRQIEDAMRYYMLQQPDFELLTRKLKHK